MRNSGDLLLLSKQEKNALVSMYLLFIVLGVAVAVGWVLNILDILNSLSNGGPVVLDALRALGVFIAPLGALLGYLT
jgi:hypothetical protein